MKIPYNTLVKREFWEHRSLWIAPASAAAFLVLAAVAGAIFAPGRVQLDGMRMGGQPGPLPPMPDKLMLMTAMGIASMIVIVACITTGIYLLDCLFAERKDRSILFWKSLPVSDRDTVLSKFGVALVVVPAGVFLLQMVTNLLLTGIVVMASRSAPPWLPAWNIGDWLAAQAQFAGMIAVTLLWYAPVAAWLMLASVYARRAALLVAILPWALVTMAERITLDSANVWRFIGRRMSPVIEPLDTLASPGLWIGLAAAAGMLYMVIRLRRYRDDT